MGYPAVPMLRWSTVLVFLFGLAGCDGCGDEAVAPTPPDEPRVQETRATPVEPDAPRPDPPGVERVELQLEGVDGLSGLALDGDGALWAVPEESRVLVRIDPTTGETEQHPIAGCPATLELEALTWIEGRRFAAGTETAEDRSEDALLVLEVQDEAVQSEPDVTCPYEELWSMRGVANRGIEGLCHVDGHFIVASELVATEDGARFAPVGHYNRSDEQWTPYRLRLSSAEGKLSALVCRPAPGGVLVYAVERHFGVSHLLRFVVPFEGSGGDITPELVLDLDELFSETILNFEGIAFMPDGRLALISDNFWRERTGPSFLVQLDASLWDR